MMISGGRTKQLVIIAGFLQRHWLYESFSQFHTCGTYSFFFTEPSIDGLLCCLHRYRYTATLSHI